MIPEKRTKMRHRTEKSEHHSKIKNVLRIQECLKTTAVFKTRKKNLNKIEKDIKRIINAKEDKKTRRINDLNYIKKSKI